MTVLGFVALVDESNERGQLVFLDEVWIAAVVFEHLSHFGKTDLLPSMHLSLSLMERVEVTFSAFDAPLIE